MHEQLREKEGTIVELNGTIEELKTKIAGLENQLNNAMQSGDEATKALRK